MAMFLGGDKVGLEVDVIAAKKCHVGRRYGVSNIGFASGCVSGIKRLYDEV